MYVCMYVCMYMSVCMCVCLYLYALFPMIFLASKLMGAALWLLDPDVKAIRELSLITGMGEGATKREGGEGVSAIKSFKVVLTRELFVLAILKGGANFSTL